MFVFKVLPRTASSMEYALWPHSQMLVLVLNTMLKRICIISNVAPFNREIWSPIVRDL